MNEIEVNLAGEEDTQKDRYLIFSIDNENYGIEIKYVTEIIGIQMITEVPDLPEYIKGIINLRGKIIPVMDVRLRLKKQPGSTANGAVSSWWTFLECLLASSLTAFRRWSL